MCPATSWRGRWQLTAGPLLQGLGLTLEISAISLVLAFAIGLVTALLSLSDSLVGRAVARAYLETIRNTPMLVQLFVIYFILGPILGIERFLSAVMALSLFEGAYASEVFRAGIVSIQQGTVAGLPQPGPEHGGHLPLRDPAPGHSAHPAASDQPGRFAGQGLLPGEHGVAHDLTLQAGIVVADTFMPFEIWFTTAAMYLVITVTLSTVASRMEQRMKIAG